MRSCHNTRSTIDCNACHTRAAAVARPNAERRGESHDAPENTLAAVRLGFEQVGTQTTVQLTG